MKSFATSAMSKPEIHVFPDNDALSLAAAELFAEAAQRAIAKRGRFLTALSGGGTPQKLFQLLSRPPYQHQISWSDVHIYWGDERLVPPGDPGSNFYHARKLLLDHVELPAENIHRVRGEIDGHQALALFRRELQKMAGDDRDWPRLDLILLGLGDDGHTASLFPGPITSAEKERPLILVNADYDSRPSQRLSMTPLVINDAREVLFLLTGESKAQALAAVLQGPNDPEKWPAQRIQLRDGKAFWFVDQAAAGQISGH